MTTPNDIIACPTCDVMYRLAANVASQSKCRRCGTKLSSGKAQTIVQVVGLSLTSAVLMVVVLFLPFLDLRAGTFKNSASVFDTIMGFNEGIMVPLSFAVLAFIVVLPLTRVLALVFALIPIAFDRPALPGAASALRLAFVLKPWAMAEIFMIGVAVALVKLSGMAAIQMGPAFWAFAGVVMINAFQETFMCRHTLWTALKT